MSDDKRFDSEESVAAYEPIRGRRRIGCLAVVFVVGGAMYAGYELWLDRCPLAAIEKKDISSIQATTWLKRPDDRVKFAVSRELGLEMIALLEPNHVDLYPAKWGGLGVLNIELTRGARYLVILYETHEEEGAFRINGWYYRGGAMDEIRKLLQKGYSEATDVKKLAEGED